MKVSKCCFCIPISMAVFILGFWMLFMLLAELAYFNIFRTAANILALGAYLILWDKDTEKNRENFFYAFTIYIITLISVSAYLTYF